MCRKSKATEKEKKVVICLLSMRTQTMRYNILSFSVLRFDDFLILWFTRSIESKENVEQQQRKQKKKIPKVWTQALFVIAWSKNVSGISHRQPRFFYWSVALDAEQCALLIFLDIFSFAFCFASCVFYELEKLRFLESIFEYCLSMDKKLYVKHEEKTIHETERNFL